MTCEPEIPPPPPGAAEQLHAYLVGIVPPIRAALARLNDEGWSGDVGEDERPFMVDEREQLRLQLVELDREDLVAELIPDVELQTWEQVAADAEDLLAAIAVIDLAEERRGRGGKRRTSAAGDPA